MKHMSIRTLDEFKTLMADSVFTQTTEATTLPNNTYAYNDTYKALRINDSSATNKGSIHVALGTLSIGDSVEVRLDVMNVSGVKAKIVIDAPLGAQIALVQSEKYGEFETIGGKFVIISDNKATLVVGLFTADIGDFYIRNIKIIVNGGIEGIYESGSNSAGSYIKFNDGTMICSLVATLDGIPINIAVGSIFRSGSKTFNFPAPFISIPTVSSPTFTGNTLLWGSSSDSTNTLHYFYVMSPVSVTPAALLSKAIATGRWR